MWWPLATHSIAGKTSGVSIAFESLTPGGQLVERWSASEAHVWGTIIAIDPDARIVFTWHVGRKEDQAQLIELTFKATAPGRTRVQLVHSGWESLGETAEVRRNEYHEGWNFVLSRLCPRIPHSHDQLADAIPNCCIIRRSKWRLAGRIASSVSLQRAQSSTVDVSGFHPGYDAGPQSRPHCRILPG